MLDSAPSGWKNFWEDNVKIPTGNNFSRRAFVRGSSLVLASAAWSASCLNRELLASEPELRIALVTDLHYADKPPAGTRHYRQTVEKLAEAAGQFQRDQPAFLVELGDLIDAADSVDVELGYLKTINQQLTSICPQRHYVLGNHCVDMLTKDEFLSAVGQKQSYYSFDHSGFHFVVLDCCYRSDGISYGRKNSTWTDTNMPPEELAWLKQDLASTDKPVVVFAHQRLDVKGDHGVKNNPDVRKILEATGRVLAVFQGHSHKNDIREIAGIHYCTLVAMVEGSGADNNGYSMLELRNDGLLHLRGFRMQHSRLLRS
jgi:Calcineurin-like phosphoesterase